MFYRLRNTYAMVRVFTYHAALAAALLPLAFGCKRENPNQLGANPVTATPEINKVQQWLKGNPKALTGLRQTNTIGQKVGTTLPSFTLQWQAAKFDAAAHTHWVPAVFVNTKQAGVQPNTYLIATENEQGQITGGQYVMVLPDAKKMGKYNTSYSPIAMLAEKKPKDFSGTLLYYDIQGELTGSQVYEAGQLQPKATANLAARDEGQGSPSPNKVQLECGNLTGTSPCIEWYWQTYVNGVLVAEDYMFTTCCDGSSSGGGGTDGCQAQLDAMVAAGQVVTNAPIEETTVSLAGPIWEKNYKWKIFTAANTWDLFSFEKGTLERVYYPSSNKTLWEFKDFVHIKLDHNGVVAGGERTYSDNGATFNKTKYTVYEHLEFGITNKTCGIAKTDSYNGETKFVAPNHIVYVQRQGR